MRVQDGTPIDKHPIVCRRYDAKLDALRIDFQQFRDETRQEMAQLRADIDSLRSALTTSLADPEPEYEPEPEPQPPPQSVRSTVSWWLCV